MQFRNLSLIALIHVSAAWEVTIYNNVDGCNAKGDTNYRILDGKGSNTCYTFGKDMPGVSCGEYTSGGDIGPGGCTSGDLTPQSIFPRPDDEGSCQFFSDDNCNADQVASLSCIDTSSTVSKKIQSFKCNGAPDRSDCKMTFNRRSMQKTPSYLASVEHTITIKSLEKDLPDAEKVMVSCSRFFKWQWGEGCGWGKEETTAVDNDWSIEHEVYNAYDDFGADIKLHGNSCDKTALKCKGTHGGASIPAPPGGSPSYMHMSETKCSLDGTELEELSDKEKGDILLAQLKDLNMTTGFDGDWSTVKQDVDAPGPGPYKCDKVASKESADSKCPGYWKCVDSAVSITAYFNPSATFSATMTVAPTADPIASPTCTGMAKRSFSA